MTDQEYIASLEASNDRLKTRLIEIREVTVAAGFGNDTDRIREIRALCGSIDHD